MNSSQTLDLVRVAVPVPLRRHFDYLSPLPLPAPGCRVEIPFGPQTLVGLVVDHPTESQVPRNKLKPLKRVLDSTPVLGPDILALMAWSAGYYQHPLGEVLPHALPVLVRKGEPAAYRELEFWFATEAGMAIDLNELKRAAKQQQALALLRKGPQTPSALKQEEVQSAALTALEKKGLLEKRSLEPSHDGDWATRFEPGEGLRLNGEQALAVAAVTSQSNKFGAFLLDGITGSGKTEVYLSILEPLLKAGKQALVMVPEIGLTPQTINRFRRRFNVPVVAMNSAMNDRERLDAWLACRDGGAAILIGTRSAVFTPFKNLGIIIIDEEHDGSFKQQDGFRYHARDIALYRAHLQQCPVVLGSATPSIDSYALVQNGKMSCLELNQRAGAALMPKIHILDLKVAQKQHGISQMLLQEMKKRLDKQEQVLVFLNRRGYAPVLICESCAWQAKCPHCDANFTVHRMPYQHLHCHHCGTVHRMPDRCPQCSHSELKSIGMGTAKVEESLNELFPDYEVIRVDRDSTSRAGSWQKIYDKIQKSGPLILLGTQMLAKGHQIGRAHV